MRVYLGGVLLEIQMFLIAGMSALVVSSILLPLGLVVLRRGDLVDHPNSRSLHTTSTPRGAGMALALGVIAALTVSGTNQWFFWLIPIGFSVLGAWDDVSSRSAWGRFALQLIIASLGVLGILLSGTGSFLLFLVGVLIIVSTVNATNFMDGINGITALNAVVWGFAYALMLINLDSSAAVPVAGALAAIGVAFLPWNFPSARMFLGDSGSYLIGGMASLLAFVLILEGQWVAALCPLATYAADTGSTFFRRLLRGENPITPHSSHVFQRLVRLGWSHSRTAIVVAGFSAFSAGLAVLAVDEPLVVQLGILILVISVNCLYVLLPRFATNSQASR